MRKILLALALAFGSIIAMPAFALVTSQTVSAQTVPSGQSTTTSSNFYRMPMMQSLQTIPCGDDQGGSAVYYQNGGNGIRTQMPCRVGFQSAFMNPFATRASEHLRVLVGLVFVITIVMVWAVLLLLIVWLWHHVQKHGRH